MNTLASKFSPTITDMIRMDHVHLLSTFHHYSIDDSAGIRQALVDSACIALEIHTQLEEEIFYPALQVILSDNAMLDKSIPEHDAMRSLIARLRTMTPEDVDYDNTFMELMQNVMHHIADEETRLLPEAERMLKDQLRELGAQMTKRHLQLAKPHAGELATDTARAFPTKSMLMAAGALLAGTYLVKRSFARSRHA